MDKSYLQGKIIILHEKLINKLKAQVILLEEELEKGGFRCQAKVKSKVTIMRTGL